MLGGEGEQWRKKLIFFFFFPSLVAASPVSGSRSDAEYMSCFPANFWVTSPVAAGSD